MQTYQHTQGVMLHKMQYVSNRLMSAIVAAAQGYPEHEFMARVQEVATETRELLITLEGLPVPDNSFLIDSQYVSQDVPEGYNTVYGYIEAVIPGRLDEVRQSLSEAYRREERRIRSLARRRKMPLCMVPAPLALWDEGVEEIMAYPISLLREVLY